MLSVNSERQREQNLMGLKKVADELEEILREMEEHMGQGNLLMFQMISALCCLYQELGRETEIVGMGLKYLKWNSSMMYKSSE